MVTKRKLAQQAKERREKRKKVVFTILGMLATTLGFWGVPYFYPKVELDSSDARAGNDKDAIPLVITNNSAYPIRNLRLQTYVAYARNGYGMAVMDYAYPAKLPDYELGPKGDSETYYLTPSAPGSIPLHPPIVSADVTFDLSYDFLWFHSHHVRQRFIDHIDSRGLRTIDKEPEKRADRH